MNIKRIGKIIFLILAIYVLVSSIYTVKATEGDGGSMLKKMEGQATDFINAGKTSSKDINYDGISNEFKGLGQILTMIGAGVMVAITTYMGIKYLTAGPEAQAKLKVQLIGVVVSGVVIFGAYSIWSMVIRVASQF